jgi:hypothetical protein
LVWRKIREMLLKSYGCSITCGTYGHSDYFVSTLIGKFSNSGVKYKGTLILDVNVNIGE